ncbi:hypothetical protein F5884DRAFT_406326 [Xylogone sp. PMI_703]|nr:hypothetical protein F5884DRAFT_406326 [Xylogone sp. PMI_703]
MPRSFRLASSISDFARIFALYPSLDLSAARSHFKHLPWCEINMDVTAEGIQAQAPITQCSRRPHRKTRTGCKTCKARKVKCDEVKPHCKNCLRRSVLCEYTTQQLPLAYQSPASPRGEHGGFSPQSSNDSFNHESRLDLDIIDMKLLHHYATSTYRTLRCDPVQRTIWQINVCEVAFSNDFVLHGILAIAALHLAYLRPSQKNFYITRGTMHYQLGLRVATNLLPSMNEANCTPLWLFSCLAGIFALASPRTPEDFLLVNSKGFADWIVLIRGTNSIIDSSEQTLYAGPLGLMFQTGRVRFASQSSEPFMLGSEHDNQVQLLQQRILSSCVDPGRTEAYTIALSEIRKSLNVLYSFAETYEATDAFIWVFRAPESYFALLKDQDQDALCIFALYCVLLHQLTTHWWAEGWSIHLMNQIYRLLDDQHQYWVQWPIKQIGGMTLLRDVH